MEFHGLKREIEEETGLIIGEKVVLVEKLEEFFYSDYHDKAFHSHRYFYQVSDIVGGAILKEGNGHDTIAARFVPVSEMEAFTNNEMKQKYKDILHKVLKI